MSNVVAIIQARMGSTRLPGKVLMDIEGKPMLWHVVNRLSGAKLIGSIVIATTSNTEDDKVEEFCKLNNINVYTGSEGDVLDRYYQAAKFYKADVVLRITSDCPLIDPRVCDKVISSFLENKDKIDFCSNIIKRTYPRGLDTEVLSFSSLQMIWQRASEDRHREHVTLFIYENLPLFKVLSIENSTDLSSFRWTVDKTSDLEFVRHIYSRLFKKGKVFLMDDIIKAIQNEPHLSLINKDVK